MYEIDIHYRIHGQFWVPIGSVVRITMNQDSTIDALNSLGVTINCIDSWF